MALASDAGMQGGALPLVCSILPGQGKEWRQKGIFIMAVLLSLFSLGKAK